MKHARHFRCRTRHWRRPPRNFYRPPQRAALTGYCDWQPWLKGSGITLLCTIHFPHYQSLHRQAPRSEILQENPECSCSLCRHREPRNASLCYRSNRWLTTVPVRHNYPGTSYQHHTAGCERLVLGQAVCVSPTSPRLLPSLLTVCVSPSLIS